jgi:predicted O-methyltransferase YrrM
MSLVCDREPLVVLEIGTYNGATTRLIARNLPRAKIHTLDLPPDISSEQLQQSKLPKDDLHLIGKRRVGEAFLADPAITNITQHYGDSATWDFGMVQ